MQSTKARVEYSMSSFEVCGQILHHHFMHHENYVPREDHMPLSQLTDWALGAVSDIELGRLRHQEPPFGINPTASTPFFVPVQGRIARIVTYLIGLETLHREKDNSSRPSSLKCLTEILKSSSATIGGEYKPFSGTEGHALSIFHPTFAYRCTNFGNSVLRISLQFHAIENN